MLAFLRAMGIGMIVTASAALLLGLTAAADAQSTGSVRFKVSSVGFIVGGGAPAR